MADTFLRVLALRPHRAIAVAYWYATGRRVRARNRLRAAAASAPFAYRALIGAVERDAQVIAAAPAMIASWSCLPLLSVLLTVADGTKLGWIPGSIRSITRQCYPNWELVVVGPPPAAAFVARAYSPPDPRIRFVAGTGSDDAGMLAQAIGEARGSHVCPLVPGIELSPTALFRFVEALQHLPRADLLYGDEDTIDESGRRSDPWFKPRWNAELALATDYVSHACFVECSAAREASAALTPECAGYSLTLAAATGATEIVQVPHVVAHVRQGADETSLSARVQTVARLVAACGASAAAAPFDTVKVRWPLPRSLPSVDILVPTRDRVELVRTCVDSVLALTRYPAFGVTIIDNGTTDPATLAYFAEAERDRRVRVLPCPIPYNFAAINNYAAARSSADYFCFLNNDTEVIDDNWLEEMMRQAVRSAVGAVGAKLLYGDRTIQHAGVVIGLGNAAGHAHRGLTNDDPGYFALPHTAHYVSAVTAACLVVARARFDAVGGFDAEHLAIAYNDVDLCLKLEQAGWRNVYTPHAVLLHHESRSRGNDLSPAHFARYSRELAVFQARWNTVTVVDPMHHPRLDRGSETYRFAV